MKTFLRSLLFNTLCILYMATPAFGDVTLPKLISDGMVLQRDTRLNIWGWASPGEKVTVRFAGKTYRTAAGSDSRWNVVMNPLKEGGPYIMEIRGNNTITVRDILVGDVWFCAGQSNMVLNMERVKERYPADIASASFPEIRNFFVPTASDVRKVHDDLPPGKWVTASPENVLGFGALTFFFARSIFREYNVPIGIINSSVGGTPIEAWVSAEGLREIPKAYARIERLKDTAYLNRAMRPQRPSAGPTSPRSQPVDKGTSGPLPWYDVKYVPEGWHRFWLPGYWDDQGVKGLNGVVWFRKEIDVPASMTGKPAKLFLGRIIDADNTYVNGVPAGSVTYQYPPRRYDLPAGLLKPGKNSITVRITNNSGKGGFVPGKPYYLASGGDTIDLRGDWLYKVGMVFDPAASDVSRGVPPLSMQNEPAGLYNTMVAPAINYAIKGFLWYHGETNASAPQEYAQLLPALINDWRAKWNQGLLPFLYVQLPNFMEVRYLPSESQWAELRFSQLKALSVPNTAMAVAIDAGEWNDIHPLEKKIIGERLALAARKLAYNDERTVYSGPLVMSAQKAGNKIIISFDHTGGGLMAKGGGSLNHFAVAAADRKFKWADAEIEGDKVVLTCPDVSDPLFVRYAWADNPESANLYNRAGLPASPFEAEIIK